MPSTDKAFTGSIPALYETHLVPPLFQPHADVLARRLAENSPQRVLEIAAGTGAATRAIVAALPGARIVATDLNEPMLAQARQQGGVESVEWRQADAMALPFADASFDAVACQFGVMFLPDKVAGYREIRRVLAPGGVFIFNVWDRIETTPYAEIVSRTVAELFPEDPPAFLERAPYAYHDKDAIHAALTQAGFASVTMEDVELPGPTPSAADVAMGFCQGTPLRAEIEARDPARLDAATQASAKAIAARFGEGPLRQPTRAILVSARNA